jgi:hypothetical protein
MSGAFGCNNASGSYRYDGQTLTAGPLAMTRMACPSMRFETEAAAILSQPAIVTWSADNSVILRNQAGESVWTGPAEETPIFVGPCACVTGCVSGPLQPIQASTYPAAGEWSHSPMNA